MARLLSIEMSKMMDTRDAYPNPVESQVILARVRNVPVVMFWLEGRWETEQGESPEIESWIYLKE